MALPAVLAICFVILFLRLWYLQVMSASELAEAAAATRTTTIESLAPRGLVEDRRGNRVAGVAPEVVITAVPSEVRERRQTLAVLAQMLATPQQRLEAKLADAAWRPYLPSPIYVGAGVKEATRIAELGDQLPGLDVRSQPMRTYRYPRELAHVLGYVWTPSASDVERLADQGIKAAEYVGKLGIERRYEADLMGVPGREVVEIDAKRRPQRTTESLRPIPGSRLTLGIDADLQRYALDLLDGRPGAIVAVEPATGEVLALASSPTYDASLFLRGIAPTEWAALRDDPAKPMLNRAIYSSYAPGSTFKVVTALAAQSVGKFDAARTVTCDGFYQVGNRRFRCLGRHGRIAFRAALTRSCNTYFADLAVRAGEDALRRASLAVGLGERTGIDIPGEGRGVVPTAEWIARWRKPPRWYAGDTVNFGNGQGEISVTPLQMACLAALVANRGISYRPRIVRAVTPWEQTPLPTSREELGVADAPPAFWAALDDALRNVVRSGTAARISDLPIAGKTGSAENRRGRDSHSWFFGYAPAESPRIAFAVIVENAGHGGDVAAPLAGELVRFYLSGRRYGEGNSAIVASTAEASRSRPTAR